MSCAGLIITQVCTGRLTPGRPGFSAPIAIVLHGLGVSLSEYDARVAESVTFAYPTVQPKSVHYAIGYGGAVHQYLPEQDTAWGLAEYHNPTWPLIPAALDVNAPYLHIGLEGSTPTIAQVLTAARLICCAALTYSISVDRLHILVARDLDDRQTALEDVPAGLIAQAQICVQNGGADPLPNVVELEHRVDALEVCCTLNSANIGTLTAAVTALQMSDATQNNRIAALETWRATAEPIISGFAATVAALQQQLLGVVALLNAQQRCLDKLCPPDNATAPIHYVLLPGQEQTMTPDVPRWLNPPTKLSDTTPSSVLAGPLWTANLTAPCTYRVEATVRLGLSEYCAGEKVWIDLVACGVTTRIAQITTSAGPQSISLSGSTLLVVPPVCNDVHFLVGTSDRSTPTKTISAADVQIACT